MIKNKHYVLLGLVLIALVIFISFMYSSIYARPNSSGSSVSQFQFSSSTYSVDESSGTATITVTRTGKIRKSATVVYATDLGTAYTDDFTQVAGTIQFTSNQNSATFSIPILDDTIDENDETIIVGLYNPTNAVLGSPSTAIVTIIDNDLAPSLPTVNISNSSYIVNENAGNAIVTIQLLDSSGSLSTVTSSQSIIVDYSTSNGTAASGSDYTATSGTLTFELGQTSKQVNIPILNDSADEPNETISFTISNPTNATLGGLFTATVTIIDDDSAFPLPTINFGASSYSVNENVGNAVTTVQLSQASSATITVYCYSLIYSTATVGNDYADPQITLSFSPGETSKECVVPIVDDDLSENNETVQLNLYNTINATIGSPQTTTITIIDNEAF